MARLMESGAPRPRKGEREARNESSGRLTLDGAIGEPIGPAEVERNVAAAVADHRRLAAAYRGGLKLERNVYAARVRPGSRSAIRGAYLGGVGQRIDLVALLRQRDRTGGPIWAIVDPTKWISDKNGEVDAEDGKTWVSGGFVEVRRPLRGKRDFLPVGLPPLPAEARAILTDRKVRRRAKWVGVLYQPETWEQVNPDPAVVCEWRDRPGEHFALAVWGGDRAQIEEFID